jgi:phytanoyl-CoA hydroxylase
VTAGGEAAERRAAYVPRGDSTGLRVIPSLPYAYATGPQVGHNLHELVPEYRAVSLEDPRIAAITRALGYTHPLVVQSMLIFKQPGIGGEVRPHVDGAFLYTEPQTCLGMWWPLEACTKSNGCLWAVPGSHAKPVRRRFKRNPAGPGTVFEPAEAEPFDVAGAVPLEIPAGALVLLHNSLVHYSEANNSERSRLAYSIHLVEGAGSVTYPKDNWLQREDGGPFPALY